MKHKLLKISVEVSRIIFGLTFMFSGIVKAIDPIGSSIKFTEYFNALNLTFFIGVTDFLSVILAALEFAIGACIIWGSFRRFATLCGVIFMIIFTPLTLWLAVTNAVSDCGCFGDAVTLSNWGTFYKNLILIALSIFLFVKNSLMTPLFSLPIRWIPALFSFIYAISLSIIGLNSLPVIDFRPYKQGINIKQEMGLNDDSETEYILVYEKDGIKKEFTLEDYPQDDDWTFVESKTIKKNEKEHSIKDFFLTNEDLEDVTLDILNNDNTSIWLVVYDIKNADENNIDKINQLYDEAIENDIDFYCLTTPNSKAVEEWIEITGAEYPFVYSDMTILETIIRANPGIVVVRDGDIVLKQNIASLPEINEISEFVYDLKMADVKKINVTNTILFSILIYFGSILVLLLFDKSLSALSAKYLMKNKK